MLNRNLDAQPWRTQAACRGRDVSIFFTSVGTNVAAYRICATCRVREECLKFALADSDLVGVWGGTSERERRRIRRARPATSRWSRRRAV